MPLYEYQCDDCGHRFEVIQKYSDAHIDTCPKCAGTVHKLFSSPAIQFKGSGFYITDYARAGKSDNATGSNEKGDKSQKADGGAAAESKSESKPDTKSESKSETKSETKSESKPAPPSTSS